MIEGLSVEFDVNIPRWSRWIAGGLVVGASWLIRLAQWVVMKSVRIRRCP